MLSISIENKDINRDFLRKLKTKFRIIIMSLLNVQQIKRISLEISELLDIEFNYIKLLELVIRNTTLLALDDKLFFIISNVKKYPDTDYKIVDLLRIAEYGTLTIRPYPVIRKSISIIKDDLDTYIKRYKVMGWF